MDELGVDKERIKGRGWNGIERKIGREGKSGSKRERERQVERVRKRGQCCFVGRGVGA